ncbi:hypothetical protein ACGYLO_10920 [Sulfitobacter sp. 1A13353]|uniref:hypothetical protein n=1 Tax=Sulfitobacter sp. 1A13353 TaxID=3368568 RepID=UPI003744FDB0
MSKHENFNKLTAAETERLAMLSEEAGEVVQAATQMLQDGPYSENLEGALDDNIADLGREVADLLAVAEFMEADLSIEAFATYFAKNESAYESPYSEALIEMSQLGNTIVVNGVDLAEMEQLHILSNRAAKIVQTVGKTLRHGFESYHPDFPEQDNRQQLTLDLFDFWLAVHFLPDDFFEDVPDAYEEIMARKMRYSHHQTLKVVA